MTNQQELNYTRIAKAIAYIKTNFKKQPTLDEIAKQIHVSPFHFQRLFAEWAGTTPKKFLQYVSIEYAKKMLKQQQATLFDTAFEIGLSGTGRLHDLFVGIEGMTPAEYKNGGKNLLVNFSFAESPFGNLILASTHKGLCYMAFDDDKNKALEDLQQKFPNATFSHQIDTIQTNALLIFGNNKSEISPIKLHLKGTNFQLKVWEALLKIPMGRLTTYGDIAEKIENPAAFRAVGTAIGSNPIAYLIPCHRVIQASGNLGGYMWGEIRKTAIIAWESAKTDSSKV
ncbi:MAG: methylated-DNA--[protein]-cysteine S-methyltransferase [Thermonemataceae bacterium]|nr:methylated-DNA--[protein]-cysteine S-methyltransferase [Thermonemataceae bacterium]